MTVIDIHTHGIGGVDTRTPRAEAILKIAETHGAYGVDAILAAVYSGPVNTMRECLAAVDEAMKVQHKHETERGHDPCDSSAKKQGKPARILGAYLEGPFLNAVHAGALDGSSFLEPSLSGLDRLIDGFERIVKVVVIAPELPGALPLISALAATNIRVSMGHSHATFAEAGAGFRAGATGVTHLFNGMRPWHHREPGLAGFALASPDLYVEVIADPFHLHESTLRLIFSSKNPDKILLVSDSVKATRADVPAAPLRHDGRLCGGSMALPGIADRLLRLGFDSDLVRRAVSHNQECYLGATFTHQPDGPPAH